MQDMWVQDLPVEPRVFKTKGDIMAKNKDENKKQDALDRDLDKVQKELVSQFGKDSVARFDSPDVLSKVSFSISTRSLIVDKVLAGGRQYPGCSLLPFGRITEIAGLNGSGKTTLSLQAIAEAQAQGALVICMDTEERHSEEYARKLGCDTARIINLHAENLEQAFDQQIKAVDIMHKEAPDRPLLLLWDSLGSITSSAMADSDSPMEQVAMGKNVRVISQGIQVLASKLAKSKTCMIYTNHLYQNISGYGEPWLSPGGQKPQFMCSVRLRLTKIGEIKEKDEADFERVIGQKVNVKSVKNSLAPTRMEYDAVILGGSGFSNEYSIFELAPQYGFIDKGAWSTWTTSDGECVKFQGFRGFTDKVVTHPKYSELVQQVLNKL